MIAAARAASMICLYFAAACLLPVPVSVPGLLLAVFLCALGCGLAERTYEKGALRYIWAILPLLALIPGGNPQRLMLILPIVYAEAMLCTDFLLPNRWRSVPVFRLTLLPYLLGLTIAASLSRSRGKEVLLFGMLYFVFRVLALRSMRMGRGVSWKGTCRETLVILTLPALAGVLAALLFGAKELLKWLGIMTVQFVGWAMNLLVRTTAGLSNVMIALRKTPDKRPEHTIPETFHEATMEAAQESSGVYESLQNILLVVLLLAAVAVVVLLIRGIVKKVRVPASVALSDSWDEETEDISEEQQNTPAHIASNRREIRRIYARYLRIIEERGFPRRRADTSREVLDTSEDYALPEESRALREIYIRARYAFDDKVTAEDVKTARELLRLIRSEERAD